MRPSKSSSKREVYSNSTSPQETRKISNNLLSNPYHNPYQNSKDIFHRNRIKKSKIYVEPQKTLNSQNNPEEKKAKLEVIIHADFKLF